MFSGFYLALLLLLFFLIVRVVSFEWRDKRESPAWRRTWMWANAGGSAGIALVWGIALSNLLQGVPIGSSGEFTGNLADLFSPYTIFAGITFILIFAFHGAIYLTLRTMGDLLDRARNASHRLAIPAVILGAAYLIWTLATAVNDNDKTLFPPVLPAVIALVALVLAAVLAYRNRGGAAFAMTALATVGVVATLFTSLYPRVMVSNPNFGNSLTVSNASSAHYTLVVMSVVALIAVPAIIVYQGWAYYVFRGRVGGEKLAGGALAVGGESRSPGGPGTSM
jgi:cytochrome d ubiquinol oxidase subunit II